MTRLVHFEVTGHDSLALARFYAEQFGFATTSSPFAPDYHLLVANGQGISGAVMARHRNSQPAILWFEVEDLDARLAAIAAAGGAAVGERHALPGQGLVQYGRDPEGNIVGLKQPR